MNIGKMNERAAALGGDVLWIRMTDGATTVRLVARPEEEEPWREVYRHFLQTYVQVDNFPKAPVCLGDESCPGCRIASQIRKSGDDQSANKAKAQRRFIWVGLSRDNPYDDDGNLKLKMLETPVTVFQGMARTANEWGLDFTDPKEGFDLVILRSSGSGIPKYEVRASTAREGATQTVVQSPLTEDELALVQSSYPDLDELTRPPEYRRFALALGFSVDEPRTTRPPADAEPTEQPGPETQPASRPEGTSPGPGPTSGTATESAEGSVCPYFGAGYDAEDDACRQCNAAGECKTQSGGGQEEEAPKRKPV